MWNLMPPLSEVEAKRSYGSRNDRSHIISELEAQVVELWPDTARGDPGTAWVYRNQKSEMPKDLYSGNGKGIIFARRTGYGFGITYNTFNDNAVAQAAKFTYLSAALTVRRFKPNTRYRIGGPKDIGTMAQNAVKARCVIQVIAMPQDIYKKRSDGIYFVNSNYLPFNKFLNILQQIGVINTDLIRKQELKTWRREMNRKGGGMVDLSFDDDFGGNFSD